MSIQKELAESIKDPQEIKRKMDSYRNKGFSDSRIIGEKIGEMIKVSQEMSFQMGCGQREKAILQARDLIYKSQKLIEELDRIENWLDRRVETL